MLVYQRVCWFILCWWHSWCFVTCMAATAEMVKTGPCFDSRALRMRTASADGWLRRTKVSISLADPKILKNYWFIPKMAQFSEKKNRYEQMLMGVSEKSNSFLRKPWSSRLFLGKDTDFHLVGAWVWPRSMVFGTSARRGWHVRGQVFVTQT